MTFHRLQLPVFPITDTLLAFINYYYLLSSLTGPYNRPAKLNKAERAESPSAESNY